MKTQSLEQTKYIIELLRDGKTHCWEKPTPEETPNHKLNYFYANTHIVVIKGVHSVFILSSVLVQNQLTSLSSLNETKVKVEWKNQCDQFSTNETLSLLSLELAMNLSLFNTPPDS